MAAKSARSVFDFLRLTRSWLKIVAASGVNFSKSVAAGAKFSSSQRVSPQFPPDLRALFQVAIAVPPILV
jgi:hypothetical protein